MVHFLNTNIPSTKNTEIALTYIYGIGRKESVYICKKLGLNPKIKFNELNEKIINNLENYIKFKYLYGFHLKRLKKQNIDFLIKLRSYRGNRHFLGYLVRGQKSRNKRLRRHI